MNEGETMELIKYLDGMRKDIEATKATVTIVAQQQIDLRNDFNEFQHDIISYRAIRAQAEIDEMESHTRGTQRKLDVLKGSSGTDEKIKTAVDNALKMRGLDWAKIWQTTVQAIIASIGVGVMGVLFWQVIEVLAKSTP